MSDFTNSAPSSLRTSDMDLEALRQQFPALQNKVYFNYGGQGPLSQSALKAIQQAYEYLQLNGPFSVTANSWVTEQTRKIRRAIATTLGVSSKTIALTENATVGCNIVLWGMEWQANDHIVITDCEHPGIVATVGELQRRFQLQVSVCPLLETLNQGDPVTRIGEYLQPQTRLVVLSHVLWNTGQVLPLGDIVLHCHRQGQEQGDRPIAVLVDGAQSVGVLPLDLEALGVDFYAFTGHKWLCGPEGVGGLYVRPDRIASGNMGETLTTSLHKISLHPTFIGWRGTQINEVGEPTGWLASAQQFEVATSAYPLYLGLYEAIALHDQWGTAVERYGRICALSQRLWQQLQSLPGVQCLSETAPKSGLVSFQLLGAERNTHWKLVQFLEHRQFYVRLILFPICVRACVHYLTLETEVDQLVKTIGEFLQTQP